MTTDAQPPQDGEWIPRYFSEFRKEFDAFKEENSRQHAELTVRIAEMEARLMWRGLGGLAIIASLAVAAARFLPA